MTHRLLPKEEWPRLEGTLLWPAAKTFDPDARVMVVECDGEILACAAYYPQWHLDGVWIKPTAPKASVGRRLLRMVRDVAHDIGLSYVWAMVASERSHKLVRALGPVFRFNCDHYEIHVRGK